MRFVRIVAKNFQAIEQVDVEFGRGLNVLYGPNDLGKSTLVDAIRAALLVPTGSAEGDRFRPWRSDLTPEVTLTFADDSNRYWRVRKSFGATNRAELDFSKDGATFGNDCRGREVDGKLRELLGWGIAAPGGKSAPRGVPRSVLSGILLAGQDEVVAVLAQTIEKDGASSGKDRLRSALAALAEDPLFAKVLKHAQSQVDGLFTPTGRRKHGKDSAFARAAAEIKKHSDEVAVLRKNVEESRSVDEVVRGLQRETTLREIARDEARGELKEIGRRFERSQLREQAHGAWQERVKAVRLIDEAAAELTACENRAVLLNKSVEACEAELVAVKARIATANTELQSAENRLRELTEGAALHRAANVARLKEERAQLETQLLQAEKRGNDLGTAVRASQDAASKQSAVQDGEAKFKAAREAWDSAKQAFANAEAEHKLSKARIMFARWKAAESASQQAAEASKHIVGLSEEATRKVVAAERFEGDALAKENDARAQSLKVPADLAIDALEAMQQQLSVAEASLDGGFSITLQGGGRLGVRATVDGKLTFDDKALSQRIVLEAERSAQLQLSDLLTIDIVGGALEKRQAVEAIRARWNREAAPALESAGVTTTAQLRDLRRTIVQVETEVAARRAEAKSLRAAALSILESLPVWEARAKEQAALGTEAAAIKARLDGYDLDVLAATLGADPAQLAARAEAVAAKAEGVLEKARQTLSESADTHTRAELAVRDATLKRQDSEAALTTVVTAIALQNTARVDLDATLATAVRQNSDAESAIRQKRNAVGERLAALDAEASSQNSAAAAVVEQKRSELDEQVVAEGALQARREKASSEFHSTRGEAENRRQALASLDRVNAEKQLAEAKRVLDTFEGVTEVSVEDLEAARARETQATASYESAHLDLMRAEGALSKVGGVAVQEQLARQEEALMLAEGRQRTLEIDADAWQLLTETLAAAESEGATHLGRALSGPVSERVAELTRGRYASVQLNQHLTTEAVSLQSGEADTAVLDALSVGTRDQVATLIRLCIAEQLKSAIVLDDHLVHTDPERLDWFRDLLRKMAVNTQVIITTCRPEDYLVESELPTEGTSRDLGGGLLRTVDIGRCLRRFASTSNPPA